MRCFPLVVLTVGVVDAFCPPARHVSLSSPSTATTLATPSTTRTAKAAFLASTTTALHAFNPVNSLLAATEGSNMSPLMEYFVQSLIANGVPALFSILVIGFAAIMFGKSRKDSQEQALLETRNPVALLYDDLYGDQNQSFGSNKRGGGFMSRGPFGGPGSDKLQLPRNAGVPDKEYIKITHLNRQLDSYQYSLQAATQSKAAAAANFRQVSFSRALGKSIVVPSAQQELLQAEAEFLKKGASLTSKIALVQTKLTQNAVDQELESLGMKTVYDLDATYNATSNETVAIVDDQGKKNSKTSFTKSRSEQLGTLGKLQRELQELELDFIQTVVKAVGPAHGAAVRTALLGDVAVRGSGGLLRALEDRPLRTLLMDDKEADAVAALPANVYLTRFPGDATASQVATLRQEATAIIRSARPGDEVLVVLQTGGGTVTGYGLAAAQLLRFKDAGLKLTIAVEQVAASGGYMMCCVADKIVASPFAVLGSIGVISEIPNVYERLKKEGVEFSTVTAGRYKRTLTPTKKVTREDFEKSKQDVEEILVLFRDFVAQNRPQLDIENVATGETWFGKAALDKKLCDEIKTVDDVLMEYIDSGSNVYEVKYEPPIENPFGRLVLGGAQAQSPSIDSWLRRGVRWVVSTIASEVKAELNEATKSSVEQRYMAADDTASRIKSD